MTSHVTPKQLFLHTSLLPILVFLYQLMANEGLGRTLPLVFLLLGLGAVCGYLVTTPLFSTLLASTKRATLLQGCGAILLCYLGIGTLLATLQVPIGSF